MRPATATKSPRRRKTAISWFVWGAPGSVELSTATGDGKRHAFVMVHSRYGWGRKDRTVCGARPGPRDCWSDSTASLCEACLVKLGSAS